MTGETWHDSGRVSVCRCTDGLHDVAHWIHPGNPQDRATIIADHNERAVLESALNDAKAALEKIRNMDGGNFGHIAQARQIAAEALSHINNQLVQEGK